MLSIRWPLDPVSDPGDTVTEPWLGHGPVKRSPSVFLLQLTETAPGPPAEEPPVPQSPASPRDPPAPGTCSFFLRELRLSEIDIINK